MAQRKKVFNDHRGLATMIDSLQAVKKLWYWSVAKTGYFVDPWNIAGLNYVFSFSLKALSYYSVLYGLISTPLSQNSIDIFLNFSIIKENRSFGLVKLTPVTCSPTFKISSSLAIKSTIGYATPCFQTLKLSFSLATLTSLDPMKVYAWGFHPIRLTCRLHLRQVISSKSQDLYLSRRYQ